MMELERAAMEQAAKDAESRLIGAAKAQTHGVARERTWQEIGIEEKVERVRDALLSLEGQVNIAGRDAVQGKRLVEAHMHNAQGYVMVPPHDVFNGGPYAWSDSPVSHALRLLR